jgi:hypothetical protein
MNKTLEFALSEALEKGYRAGRIGDSFDEMALRERIAQEIEALQLHTNHNLDYVKAKMIAIVRGHND